MAYVLDPMEQQKKQGAGQVMTGGGGVLGTGGQQLGKTDNKSDAGTPGGWYNIQDFFKANPQGGQQIKTGIESKVGQDIETAKAAIQPGQFAANAPTPIQYQEGDPLTDYNAIRAGISQSYTPKSKSELYAGPGYQQQKEKISSLQPGQMGTFADYFGAAAPSQYTPGMSQMDLALLGRERDWLGQFPQTAKTQFETEVEKPFQNKLSTMQGEEQTAQEETAKAAQGWQTAIQDFLGGKTSDIQTKLTEQQQQVKPISDLYSSYMSGNYGDIVNQLISLGYTPEQAAYLPRENMGQYLQITPGAATTETATQAALGDGGIGQYNELLNILSGVTTPSYTPVSGQEFNPGSVSYDYDKAMRDYLGLSAGEPIPEPGLPSTTPQEQPSILPVRAPNVTERQEYKPQYESINKIYLPADYEGRANQPSSYLGSNWDLSNTIPENSGFDENSPVIQKYRALGLIPIQKAKAIYMVTPEQYNQFISEQEALKASPWAKIRR